MHCGALQLCGCGRNLCWRHWPSVLMSNCESSSHRHHPSSEHRWTFKWTWRKNHIAALSGSKPSRSLCMLAPSAEAILNHFLTRACPTLPGRLQSWTIADFHWCRNLVQNKIQVCVCTWRLRRLEGCPRFLYSMYITYIHTYIYIYTLFIRIY